jgi:hypothetical protein
MDPVDDTKDVFAPSVEVVILWDDTVLHVQHLTPPRSFFVGEDHGAACDYAIPEETLGARRVPIVLVDGEEVSVVLLPHAVGTVDLEGESEETVGEVIERGHASPYAELPGARRIVLPPGSRARIRVGEVVFAVSIGNAGCEVAGRVGIDRRALAYAGLSLAAHAAVLMTPAIFVPPSTGFDDDEISSEQQHAIEHYLKAAAEHELEHRDDDLPVEGSIGTLKSRSDDNRQGVRRPRDPDPRTVSQMQLLENARTFGLVYFLRGGVLDALSASGGPWGANIDDAFDGGVLRLSGVGEGWGGPGEGDRLGLVDPYGADITRRFGQVCYPSSRVEARVGSPRIRAGTPAVIGQLPPEVVQRIVRQNIGRFRLCYADGLRLVPRLEGRIAVRFVIGRDGGVSRVQNGGSDFPDWVVLSCVMRAFYGLSFPAPESGIVTVAYPLVLSPD